MRSNAMLALVTGTLVLASACGDDGGVSPPPENEAPVASFEAPACTVDQPCTFVSTSTDDKAVTGWSWDFDGDGEADATTETAAFTYAAAGTFQATLTVRDAEGLSGTKTAAVTVTALPPDNTPPTADFTYTCTGTDCSFFSTSTDEAPGSVAGYAWDFGDGGTSDIAAPTHTYAVTVPTDFTVRLTVTDDQGATDDTTRTVTVTPPNSPPTAGFTVNCNAATCSFTSTSTDPAPGTIASYAWDFGDGKTATTANPTHVYAVVNPTDFNVTLTVTDNDGATASTTQTVSVSPPPPGAEGCTTSGTRVDCALNITSRSTIKLKLLGLSCDLAGERITIPPPSGDQVFLNVCSRTMGDSTRIFGGPGDTAFIYEAGSQVVIRFTQGTAGSGEPTPVAPAGQVTGTFPNWTINFEDGARPGDPGEPDFTDVVLQVDAVAAP
jgi:PKD repeat protein